MTGLLLAAALLFVAPQENDPQEARRLFDQAFDQHADLNVDSSLVLLRVARDADLHSLPIHLEYIHTRIARTPDSMRRLRAEYDSLSDTPLIRCLRAYVAVSQENLPAATPALIEMEANGEGGSCPTVLLARIVGDLKPIREWEDRRLEYLERAVVLEPEVRELWTSYSSTLAGAGRVDEAEQVLGRAAAAAWVHPLQRIVLNMRRAGLMRSRGDTVASDALWRAVQVAVQRDGRSGMRLIYLRELDNVVDTRNVVGNVYDDVLRRQADLALAEGAWVYEWYARKALANRLGDQGTPSQAMPEYDRIVVIADSVGVASFLANSFYSRGRYLRRLGRLSEAEADLLRSVEVATGGDSPYFLAEAYHNLFHLYDAAARIEEAARAVNHFVETVQPLYHSPLRMTAWLDSGGFRWKTGWHAAANEAYAAMVAVIDAHDEYHNYAGDFFERTGDLGLARDYYRRGAEADWGAAVSVRALNLAGLTRVFLALGQLDSAEVMARAHDAMIVEPSDPPLLPDILVSQGRASEAIRVSEEWARHRLAGGSAHAISVAYLQLADLLIRAGDPSRAIPALDLVDSLAPDNNLMGEQIESQRLRGLALAATGDTANGLRSLEQASELALRHPTTLSVRATQVSLADLLAAVGRLPPALSAYEKAAEQVETTTSSLEVDFDRVRHRDGNLEPYDGAIRAILAAPDGAPRNRDLLWWSARRKAAALTLATLGMAATDDLPWKGLEVQMGVDGHAFIDYLVFGNAVAALVLRGGRLTLHRLPTPIDSISGLTTRLRSPLTATSDGHIDLARARFDVPAAYALYRALWEPLAQSLGDADRVVISPDGPLHRVPFIALVSTLEESGEGRSSAERFVLDDYEIEYVPSARYLKRGSASPEPAPDGPASVLAVAYEAPGAESEVSMISRAWPDGRVRTVTAGDATESAIRRIEGGYDVIHYATHAVANDRDPLASFIGLGADAGADGLYHLNEIASQPRDQELVVLSGCETQTGELYAGEGLMGLTRAFLSSGVRAVVATQWPVGPATASLMEEFYSRLAVGDDGSAALRTAQVKLRSSPDTAHPFYWAGFVLHRRD